jgi:predicted NAD/FAD-binding protein
MPSKSSSQQKLFQLALIVRKGNLERSKVDQNILDIVDGDMTNKQIEDFAKTRKKSLKEHLTESLE